MSEETGPGMRENVEMALLAAGLVVSIPLTLSLLTTSTNHDLQWTGAQYLVAGTFAYAACLALFYIFTNRVVEMERKSNLEAETNGE